MLLALAAVGNLVQGIWGAFSLPGSIIVGAAALLIACFLVAGRPDRRPLAAISLIILIFLPGLLFAPLNPGSQHKRLGILLVVGISALAYFYGWHRARLRWFVIGLTIIAGIALVVQIVDPDPAAALTGRRAPIGTNAIAAGRLFSFGLVSALWLSQESAHRSFRLAWLALAGALGFGLIGAASRGPILGAVGGCLILLLLNTRLTLAARSALIAAGIAAVYYSFAELSVSGSRIASGSDSGRGSLFRDTAVVAVTHPMGVGWGNLYNALKPPSVISSQGYDQYPHNVVLEVAAEGGLLSAVLAIVLFVWLMIRLYALRADPTSRVISALLLCAISGALVSSNVVGNAALWSILSMAAVLVTTADVPRLAHGRLTARLSSSRKQSGDGLRHPSVPMQHIASRTLRGPR
ncbi:O-antigen ligase family protein [Janibacter terrae]|uniref:O-antigen ligase family protein n=1 Tax=Janibacter terrae TaxID=103817 RepID=A0ABZ2FGJ5_9MICO